MLEFLLLLFAVICLGLAAFGIERLLWFHTGWLGLGLFVMVPFIHAWPG